MGKNWTAPERLRLMVMMIEDRNRKRAVVDGKRGQTVN
jgi:hypothetical protein